MIQLLLGLVWTLLSIVLVIVFAVLILLFVDYVLPICLLGFFLLLSIPVEIVVKLMQPVCPACRRRSLTEYRLGFLDKWKYRYYGCRNCKAHFKRSRPGSWVTLPPGAANEDEVSALFWRPSSLMQPAPDTASADPLGSWYGSVQVGLPGENWPEYEGAPMLPLCQLRCAEISTLPASLSEFTLICVFVAMTGDEVISSEGERWVVRTYESLEDLVPIAYPGDASWIRSYPITWEILKKDTPPDLSCVPEEHWIDFVASGLDRRYTPAHSKVGGYRSGSWPGRIGKPLTVQMQAKFVFQTVIDGEFPWLCGPGGTLFFSLSLTEGGPSWSLDRQSDRLEECYVG